MNFIIFAKQGIKVNWATMVFNNLYNMLQDLFTLTKLKANRDNIKFGATQIIDMLFRNLFKCSININSKILKNVYIKL